MTNPTLSRPDIPTEERHPNGRKIRREALPEYANYRDTGCDLATSCLSCPFVRCRHDYPDGIRGMLLDGHQNGALSSVQLRETQQDARNKEDQS